MSLRNLLRNVPLHVKLILVAAVPATLATLMFNYTAGADGSTAIALYRFGVTYLITAINFCVITWFAHRVGENWKHLLVEQKLRRKAEKRADAADRRAGEAEKKHAGLDERLKVLEADKRCLQRLHKEWTPADDARLMNMFQDEN